MVEIGLSLGLPRFTYANLMPDSATKWRHTTSQVSVIPNHVNGLFYLKPTDDLFE